jgi:hypothetical protein
MVLISSIACPLAVRIGPLHWSEQPSQQTVDRTSFLEKATLCLRQVRRLWTGEHPHLGAHFQRPCSRKPIVGLLVWDEWLWAIRKIGPAWYQLTMNIHRWEALPWVPHS